MRENRENVGGAASPDSTQGSGAFGQGLPPAGGWKRDMREPERHNPRECWCGIDHSREWLTPFDASGIAWHESLPSPYEYQASDFNKLVAAVHEYEAALLEAREALHRCRADYHAKTLALQGRLADAETEKIERGTEILRLRDELVAARSERKPDA